jgi:hypothetical protein
MLYAYGHPDQETTSEISIIFTPNFNFCTTKITHNYSILQSLVTTARIMTGALAQGRAQA